MELEQLYSRARRRHRQLNKDVVHDLYVKFGNDLPSDAYITTCIKHARIQPLQEIFEDVVLEEEQETEQPDSKILYRAMENVRNKYELELDTFLECCVNSTYKDFSIHSGISITVLKKICMFAKTQLQNEYTRLS